VAKVWDIDLDLLIFHVAVMIELTIIKKKIVRDTCVVSTVLGDMEKIAGKIDDKDATNEG